MNFEIEKKLQVGTSKTTSIKGTTTTTAAAARERGWPECGCRAPGVGHVPCHMAAKGKRPKSDYVSSAMMIHEVGNARPFVSGLVLSYSNSLTTHKSALTWGVGPMIPIG
jgi:hypothetical protein